MKVVNDLDDRLSVVQDGVSLAGHELRIVALRVGLQPLADAGPDSRIRL